MNFEVRGDADSMAEMPESRPKGSSRKLREYGKGASNGAARRETVRPEELQLMEAVVARENLLDAFAYGIVLLNIARYFFGLFVIRRPSHHAE